MLADSLWIWLTLGAVVFQTLRNVMHRVAASTLPIASATTVRFIFALPFAAAFFLMALAWTGSGPLAPTVGFAGYVLAGALVQSFGSALMLLAMRERSFVVTIALTKTEPIQVALLSFLMLGETIGVAHGVAALVACVGVLLITLAPTGATVDRRLARPALLGLAAGGIFGLAAVVYRAAMMELPPGPFFLKASQTLFAALTLQFVLMVGWLRVSDPGALAHMLRTWRLSAGVGGTGALASQMWFAAYALQSATLVSVLGLVEVLAANVASNRWFREHPTPLETVGIVLLTVAVIRILIP